MIENFRSPVAQDFIWFADYENGEVYTEYDFETKAENSFYNINRDMALRFGLVGLGMPLYYEVYGGTFKLAGMMLEFIYKVGEMKEYYLTGQQKMYNDIISYKDAEVEVDFMNRSATDSKITQYNFGYKAELEIGDIAFNFKPICKIRHGSDVYMNLRLVANKDLDGALLIKKNGKIVAEIEAPLKENVGGELNWIVQ